MTPSAPRVEPTLIVERSIARGGLVIGIDEVGRGALAGPVCIGAVAIDPSAVEPIVGVRDSKDMTPRARAAAVEPIRAWATASGVGEASADEIEELGIVAALGIAARRALVLLHHSGIDVLSSVVLLDGTSDFLTSALRAAPAIVVRAKADRDCASVAAASVLAKEHRDALMIAADEAHPGYGWASNKGYGAAVHRDAIALHGLTPLHRASWCQQAVAGASAGSA